MSAVDLTTNVRGRVRNTELPVSRPLLPLFEAVVNGLQAIEAAAGSIDKGTVRVEVLRSNAVLTLAGVEAELPDIIGFVVSDNGIGFTAEHWQSFLTADSTLKQSIGGKGVGRFVWLKAFEQVEIESVFEDADALIRRRFVFSEDGVGDVELEPASGASRGSSVRLAGFRERYQKACPKKGSTIAQSLLEHCISYFMLGPAPAVIVVDGNETHQLRELYRDTMEPDATTVTFELAGNAFELRAARLFSPDDRGHRLHFCAHKRDVTSEKFAGQIPNLARKLRDGDGKMFWWWAFVSGGYLDEAVNQERTRFNLPEAPDLGATVGLREIRDACVAKTVEQLAPLLAPIQKQKLEDVHRFIKDKAPQYRPLLKHRPEAIDSLSPDLPDDKLELELHRVRYQTEQALKQEAHTLAERKIESVKDAADYEAELSTYMEKANDLGKANLAEYVVHRRVVLDLLFKTMRLGDDGKYPKEEAIHRIVFPLQASSDDVEYEQQNLWILDERLSFHQYLGSDKRFSALDAAQIDDKRRPDVVAFFDHPFAFSDGDSGSSFSSIAIVEFKRPGRDDYTDADNPITQVISYVRILRQGDAKDIHGRPVEVAETMPFYCYIVCDITPKIRELAENHSFVRFPDNRGYFHFNNNIKAYIEIVGYNKLLDDAKQRNRVLFEKLHLPSV